MTRDSAEAAGPSSQAVSNSNSYLKANGEGCSTGECWGCRAQCEAASRQKPSSGKVTFVRGQELEEKPNTKTKSKENQTVHSPGSGDYGGFFFLIPAIDVILFVL